MPQMPWLALMAQSSTRTNAVHCQAGRQPPSEGPRVRSINMLITKNRNMLYAVREAAREKPRRSSRARASRTARDLACTSVHVCNVLACTKA